MSEPQTQSATPQEIAALRDALAKATPGEWVSAWDTDKKPQPIEPESSLGESWVIRSTSTDLTADKDGLVVSTMYYDGLWAACTAEDARAIVAAYNLAPKLLAALELAHNLLPKLLAALDEAQSDADAFAFDVLGSPCSRSTEGAEIWDDCCNSGMESAAKYLESRGLLKRVGEFRLWERVEAKP